LNLSSTLKVLSILRTNGVSYLLMGGQACVLYGGAEFSRDTDLVRLGDDANLERLRVGLAWRNNVREQWKTGPH